MIKLILWFLKTCIYGSDLTIDFGLSMSFEEALVYLNRGYFIYDICTPDVLYVKIRNDIYAIYTKKGTSQKIQNFSVNALNELFKVIPDKEYVNKLKEG